MLFDVNFNSLWIVFNRSFKLLLFVTISVVAMSFLYPVLLFNAAFFFLLSHVLYHFVEPINFYCASYIYTNMQVGLLVVSSVLLQHIPSSTAAVKSYGLWHCVEPRGGSHWSPSLSLFTENSANIPLPRTSLLSFITMTTYFSLWYITTAASHINPPNCFWLWRRCINWMVKGDSKSITILFI